MMHVRIQNGRNQTTVHHFIMTHLISRRLELDPWTCPHHNEGVQKVAFYAGRREMCVVSFEENDANDIVANMPFSLQLLRVILLMWQ